MNIVFTLHYATRFGENIFLHLSQNGVVRELALSFVDAQTWSVCTECSSHSLSYHYSIQDASGQILREELPIRTLSLAEYARTSKLRITDYWNLASFPEFFLLNKIWKNQQLTLTLERLHINPTSSHVFEIHAPLYHPSWAIHLVHADRWIPTHQAADGLWQVDLNLSTLAHSANGFEYRYGIFDTQTQTRIHAEPHARQIQLLDTQDDCVSITHDACYDAPEALLWRAAGVAVPVFALRSERALGNGEFLDLKLLADWAHQSGISVVQLLPINDSTVDYSWSDQYPYSAISVYALHPQYLSISALPYTLSDADTEILNATRLSLNALDSIDFESMITVKWRLIRSVFAQYQDTLLADVEFHRFIADNDWLKSYAVFCVLRDRFGTLDFSQWQDFAQYDFNTVEAFFHAQHPLYLEAILHCFVQYHLHLQLSEAVDYAHSLGIALKGDLPIGVRRYSVDTWCNPDLFAMDFQAGAPPDMFSELGQNWEFPLYNWARMRTDGYQWWGNRMCALAQYFDAMRIDHVLGFFRIWCVPASSTQGLLGFFSPAIGVTEAEFAMRGIDFDMQRFCQPWITSVALEALFGDKSTEIATEYLTTHATDAQRYQFKPAFDTQRKIVDFFHDRHDSELVQNLLKLHTEVLFIAERLDEKPARIVYHPRFNQHQTQSYQALDKATQDALRALYIDYYFVRQESLWRDNGLEKLPALQNASDMLICAEDLGLVPACVPDVLNELGITALKIQRAPSDDTEFSDPLVASYLNVVTPSSHDSSTLRQWWTENPELTQCYFTEQLKQEGRAPEQLSPELANQIIVQHLNSPAMLAIFPLQDLLATSPQLAHLDVNAERINNPANPNHRWNYRMHLSLEQLLSERAWNQKMREQIVRAHRLPS